MNSTATAHQEQYLFFHLEGEFDAGFFRGKQDPSLAQTFSALQNTSGGNFDYRKPINKSLYTNSRIIRTEVYSLAAARTRLKRMRLLLSELCNVSIISWKTAIDRSPTCCNGVISQSGHRETR
jgi:hypothetical protein